MPANVTQTGQKDDLTRKKRYYGEKEEGRSRQRMPDMPNVRQRMHDDSGNGDWLTGRPLALFDAGGRFKLEGGGGRGLNEGQPSTCPASIHGRCRPSRPELPAFGAEKLKGRNPESATTGSTWPLTMFQNVIGNNDPRAVPALAGDTFPFFQYLDLKGKSSPQEESFGFATTSTKGHRPLVFQRLSAPPASTRGDDAMKPRLAHLGPDVAVSAG
ncbi:hypothetical protein QR685DRAFT_567793 [Neurospora intermedia]|uniref:Uncharacterized protein n=1 Tax=Neurospora intermedia TaxID=5142 RepID=A0ABR3DQG5_NEUIN